MSTAGAPYLAGAALGGTTMSLLSALGTFALEKKKPTPKTLARDFILGAVLMLLILQLLPESAGKLIGYVMSFAAVPAAAAASSTVDVVAEAAASAAESVSSLVENVVGSDTSNDLEVKIGVPRF